MHQYNILIALAGLDVGGTETYVVLLCKNLKALGYNVIVASSGGIYVKELESYGIKHYNIKLNTKKPWEVLKSYKALKKIIKEEHIQLIHAHARVPAFICNIAAKTSGVHFITNAHAKFRVNFILRRLSAWGEKTIAVSEDIKAHLENSFKVKSDNISIITNGIDTDVFDKNVSYEDIINEFNIDESAKKLVWISRIDDDLEGAISCLINSTQLLYNDTNFVLIIVGSGNRLDEIRELAQKQNNMFDKNRILVIGKRTDINKFINLCDVFIGISRAALEAMACQKPVIIAGPWSFVGMVNQNNIKTMTEDNFTGRNSNKKITKELLADSIKTALNLSKQEKASLGEFEREIVLKEYSSTNMVAKTIEIYKSIINKGEHI